MNARFRPLPIWPHPSTPPGDRRGRPFKAGWAATLELLDRELAYLDGANVMIAAGFRESDLRLDGWPKADARSPDHPGIEISFDSRFGRLVYATDVCRYWEDNVRSIALGLEALRAVDRYGVSTRGQQYAGWRPLTAGSASNDVHTVEDARRVLILAAGLDPSIEDATGTPWRTLYRTAAKRLHPDVGGTKDQFERVDQARSVLERAGVD